MGLITSSRAQEVWYAPGDQLPNPAGKVGDPDYMQLFAPASGSQWPQATSHIQVLVLNQRFPARASDSDLTTVFAYLRTHNIRLSTAMSVLPGRDCGNSVEGFTLPGTPIAMARRIKQLGGNLYSISMDEPFMFGHVYQGPNACHFSIEEVAAGVAQTIHAIREIFPNVLIGDGEPATQINGADWLQGVENWLDAYERATGTPLAYLQDDPNWSGSWRERMPQLAALLKRKHVPFGVMFTTTGQKVGSDVAWIATAQQNIRNFQSLGVHPDQVIFTSWDPYPSHVLPETSPTTLTYLIDWYAGTQH
jgi:hypothetical protein